VIQHIYDSHYEGAAAVAGFTRDWQAIRGRLDDVRYEAIRRQLEYQAGQAVVWRDAVSRWFLRSSGIPDAKGRVGTYPGRMEAESATLEGYVVKPVTPWETASADHAVECTAATCTATFKYTGASGRRDIIVQYFDVNAGAAHFSARVGNRVIGQWTAADRLPTRRLDGSSSSRRIIGDVLLKTGDEIQIEGVPDGAETAALDYIEIQPAGNRPAPVRR
jgi:alpha-glucuronidase